MAFKKLLLFSKVLVIIYLRAACRNIDGTADIFFILDSSGSISPENFNKMKDFVKSVVEQFDVGLSNVRIGVITFRRVHKRKLVHHICSFAPIAESVVAASRISEQYNLTYATVLQDILK